MIEIFLKNKPIYDSKSKTATEMIVELFKDDFYNQMRIQEKLSYTCNLDACNINGVQYLYFVITSLKECKDLIKKL